LVQSPLRQFELLDPQDALNVRVDERYS